MFDLRNLLADAAEQGLQIRAKKWLRESEIVETATGDAIVKKSARIGVRRKVGDGQIGFQQSLWRDMTVNELLQVIKAAGKRREADAVNISIARKLVDLCIKHDTELVEEALEREGTTLDDFLATTTA